MNKLKNSSKHKKKTKIKKLQKKSIESLDPSPINKSVRYSLWTVLGILVLIGLGYAGTTLSNSNSGYLVSDNITVNNTGIFYGGAKSFTKIADVVVCRGTSPADDLIKSFECDVVCKSTDNDCWNIIQPKVANNSKMLIMPGTYYFNRSLTLANNFTIEGIGHVIFTSNGTESLWATDPVGRQGIISVTGKYPNTVFITDIIIKNIQFDAKQKAGGITIFDASKVTIEDCYFTGNYTGSSLSSVIFIDGEKNHFDVYDIKILHNTFENINPVVGDNGGIIHLYPRSGHDIDNTEIAFNTFRNVRGPAIYLNVYSNLTNTKIHDNDFIELNITTGSNPEYAVAIFGGLSNPYLIDGLDIYHNYYSIGFSSIPAHTKAGFAFIYQSKNINIKDNTIKCNRSINWNESIGFAPGRVSNPDINIKIQGNTVEGCRSFIDPDSMINADISNNIIKDTYVSSGLSIGYGIQNNIHIHDNTYYNITNLDSNIGTDFIFSIGCTPSCTSAVNPINSVIENNIIDLGNYPRNVAGVFVYCHSNASDLIIRNNEIYYNNATINASITHQFGDEVSPIVYDNSFVLDNRNNNINTTGNISGKLNWSDITYSFPSSCPTDSFITTLGTTLTCSMPVLINQSILRYGSLLLDLPFDASGNHLTDYSSKYNGDPIVIDAYWNSSGGYNKLGAFKFNGTTNFINGTDVTNLDFPINSNFTIEAWVYPISNGSNQFIYSKGVYGASARGMSLNILTNNKLSFGTGWSSTSDQTISSATSILTNKWNYVVGVRSGLNLSIYINGVLDKTGNFSTSQATTGVADPWSIGVRYHVGGIDYYFNGTIDDVKIWNRSLSANEIMNNYNLLKQREQTTQTEFLTSTPITNLIYNLGSSTLRWLKLWVKDIDASGNVNISGNISVKRAYAMFSSNDTYTMASASTSYPINFSITEDNYLIGIESNRENITFMQSGDYLIEVSAIFSVDTVNKKVELWVQKANGTGSGNFANVPRSNTIMTLPSSATAIPLDVPFILDFMPGDKLRFRMATDDAGSQLLYTTNTSYSPETPSIIVTISKISEIT